MNPFAHLATPCLLLDRDILQANLDRMRATVEARGCKLRPHFKTAKSIEVARMAQAGSTGFTVSTAREAEFLADAGFEQLFYAVTPNRERLSRCVKLYQRGVEIIIALDSVAVAEIAAEEAEKSGVAMRALLEVDCGDHRCGLEPDDPELLELAHQVHSSPHLRLEGIFTHAGHSYDGRDKMDFEAIGKTEADIARQAAKLLRENGLPCLTVSIGSTPTARFGGSLEGISEMRAGVYMLGDCFQAGIGSCRYSDMALSILVTVLSIQPNRGQIVVDAGGIALSKDRSTAVLEGDADVGYGLVARATDGKIIPGLTVAAASQEHGLIRSTSKIDFSAYPIGSQLRIYPNHACMTAAQHAGYYVASSDKPIAYWRRQNGW